MSAKTTLPGYPYHANRINEIRTLHPVTNSCCAGYTPQLDPITKTPLPTPTHVPYVDLAPSDHEKLPEWLSRFPLFVTAEMANQNVCVFCTMRFLNHRHSMHYTTMDVEGLINNVLLNQQELEKCVALMEFPYVTPPPPPPPPVEEEEDEEEEEEEEQEKKQTDGGMTTGDEEKKTKKTKSTPLPISPPEPPNPIEYAAQQRAELLAFFTSLRNALLTNTTTGVCTVCLNLLQYNDDFINFIATTVENEDYEFSTFNLRRTTPSSLSLRQYGLWHLLRYKYQRYNTDLLTNETTEGALFELKQVLKFQLDTITDRLNATRKATNARLKQQMETLQQQQRAALGPNGDDVDTALSTILNPTHDPNTPTLCNFVTPRHEINQEEVSFDATSPFKIDLVYYMIPPDYANELHRVLYRTDLAGGADISTSAAMLRRMSSIPINALTKWGLAPPTLSDAAVIPLPRTLHHMLHTSNDSTTTTTTSTETTTELESEQQQPQSSPSSKEDKFYTAEYNGNAIYQQLQYLPTSLQRYPGIDEFSHYTFMLNKYVIVQVGCSHDPIWLEGNYTKGSRLLSQTPWYRDLNFYETPRDQLPGAKPSGKGAAGASSTGAAVDAKGELLLAAIDAISSKKEAEELAQLQALNALPTTTGSQDAPHLMHDDAPVQKIQKRKRRDFEILTDDEDDQQQQQPDGKKKDKRANAATGENDELDATGGDEIASLHENDPMFTGVGMNDELGLLDEQHVESEEDDQDGDDVDEESSFLKQFNKQLQTNKEKQFSKDDADKTATNNNNNNNAPQNKPQQSKDDEEIGHGKLPYAQSSVETEIALRIIPYYHPVDRSKSGRNTQLRAFALPKTTTTTITTPATENTPAVVATVEKELTLAEVLSTPQQSTANKYLLPFRDQFSGYCSVHSTNPNGIPCVHYHRRALPGPIDVLMGKDYCTGVESQDVAAGLSDEMKFNNFRLTFFDNYHYKFHSSGREDLNVRMLGGGRPFILEILNPHRNPKHFDLAKLMAEVNAHTTIASISALRHAGPESMTKMDKEISEKRKKYRCVVYSKEPITAEMLADKIDAIPELTIIQNTPVRVMLRRSALPRPRHINNLKATYINPHFFYLDLETQSGTYIKEFVHSDKGRTHPSISSILNSDCDILQLDVAGLIM